MKLVSSKASTALLVLVTNPMLQPTIEATESADLTWTYQWYGQFGTCQSTDTAIHGICGSGENADCGQPSGGNVYTAFGCGGYPDTFNTTDNNQPQETNWLCHDYGQDASCPIGFVMTGFCGSGSQHDCSTYCDPAMAFAIKCVQAPPYTQLGEGSWLTPTGYGGPTICPTGQVACGACGSGENYDCQGGANRIKCCGAYDVLGSWEFQQQIPAATSTTRSFTVGFKQSNTYTKSSSYNEKVTATVSAGLKVEGSGVSDSLSHEQSTTISDSFSQYWEEQTTSTTSYTWDSTFAGYEVYQWVFDITDPDGVVTNALSETFAVTPPNMVPKCLPGSDAAGPDGKFDYQTCSEYLPQFEPVARRALLRGRSQ